MPFARAQAAEPAATGGDIVDLAPLVIEGTWNDSQPGVASLTELTVAAGATVAQSLAELPGVGFTSRGTHSTEPLIRGLGYDRVATSLNGLRLPNGSPTRTGAPINSFGGPGYRTVEVSRVLPSLTAGPPVSGGWISLEGNAGASGREPEQGLAGATLFFEGSPERESTRWEAGLAGAAAQLAYRAGLFLSRSGNYTSGDGREVPSHFEEAGGSLSLGFPTGNSWLHSLDAAFREQGFTENAALPLDVTDGDFHAVTMVHEHQSGNGRQWDLRLRYGFSESKSTLDNLRRPMAPVDVSTDTRTRSLHADLAAVKAPFPDWELQFGIDVNHEERLAIRKRGPVAEDYIWPDTLYRQAGVYAESRWEPNEKTLLRAGARVDHVASKAREVGKSAFGQPILSLYSQYNGWDPQSPSATDTVFSANVLMQQRTGDSLTWYGGLGTSGQVPPPTERYRAFLNALGGGFELGNPSLDPERKWELALGAHWQGDRLRLQADAYLFQFDDFIWRQAIGTTEGTLPLVPPQIVYGYRNVAAAFSGLEIHGSWQATRQIRFPFSIEWVRAELRESGAGYAKGDRLPELPPAVARLSAVWEGSLLSMDAALQWNTVYQFSRDNDLPALNPLYANAKPFTLHELSLRLVRDDRLMLFVAVRNLFDKATSPYLSLPVSSIRPASGDLVPGDRIPAPGREVVFSCRLVF